MNKNLVQMDATERVEEALRRAIPLLPHELGDQLKDLVSPTSLVLIGAVVAVVIATGGTAILPMLGVLAMAGLSLTAAYNLFSAGRLACSATTDRELDKAAAEMANAIIIGGTILLPAITKLGILRIPKVKSLLVGSRAIATRGKANAILERAIRARRPKKLAKTLSHQEQLLVKYKYPAGAAAKEGEVIKLKMTEIYTRQNEIDWGAFHAPYDPATGSIPEVYWVDWVGDKPFWALGDGNHRTASQFLAGKQEIMVRVIFNPKEVATQALFSTQDYVPFRESEC